MYTDNGAHAFVTIELFGNWYMLDTAWLWYVTRPHKYSFNTYHYCHNTSLESFIQGAEDSGNDPANHTPNTCYTKWGTPLPECTHDVVTDSTKSCKVTFSGDGVSIPTQTLTWGMPINEVDAPTKSGYRFGGWFSDAAFTKPYSFGNYIYENTTLYARMTKIESTDADFEITEGVITKYTGNGGKVVIPADARAISESAIYSSNSTSYEVAGGNTFFMAVDGVLFSKDKKKLVGFPTRRGGTYDIPSGTTELVGCSFCFNSALTAVTLPDTLKTIGTFAFWGVGKLSEITVPSSVETLGSSVFASNSSIKSVIINAPLSSIPYGTFSGAKSLTSVTLPSTINSIGENAFENCTSLKDIYFMGTKEQWNAIDKTKAAIPAKCTVHCEGGGSSEPVPASGNIIATFGGSDHPFADLTTLGKDKAFKAATGTVTITVNADFTAAQTFAFPSKATAITLTAPEKHTVNLKAATLTSKGSLTVENLELVSGKKNTGLTAKTTLTVKNSTVGALKAAATTLVTSNVNGKIAASGELTITGTQCYEDVSMTSKAANITLSNSTANKKVTSSGGVILTNGSYILGALKATGILTLNVGTHVMSTVTAGGIAIAA